MNGAPIFARGIDGAWLVDPIAQGGGGVFVAARPVVAYAFTGSEMPQCH